jgi:Domain of unknown function (DUF4410)
MNLFVADRRCPMFALGCVLLLACLAGAGCARTTLEVTRQYSGALPRPERILVHPFATSPEEVRLDWSPTVFGAWKLRGISESAEKRDVADAVARALAQRLVTKIRALGMPAELVEGSVPPISSPALAISGQFVSIDEGSRTERVVIGLGAGSSDVRTAVEVIELFPEGRRVVDEFEIDAKSGRKPGAAETMGAGAAAGHLAVSAAVSAGGSAASETFGDDVEADAERTAAKIASVLQALFVRQGWIAPEGR